MKVYKSLDNLIAMNLLGLAIATTCYGVKVCTDIPAMQTALENANKPKLPSPVFIEYSNGQAVIVRK